MATLSGERAEERAGEPASDPRRPRWNWRHRLDVRASPYLFIAPFFILFAIFGVYPLVYTIWVSLHEWNLIGTTHTFIGLDNFDRLFGDPNFWNAMRNTAVIWVVATVPQLLLALWLAHLLNHRLRSRTLFRMGVLLPNITSVTAVAIVFSQLFGQDFGLINWVLGHLGVGQIDWTAGRATSTFAIAVMVIWRWTGYNALIYLAAMQAIPRDLYESATLDGAGSFRAFRYVTIPMLRPTIIFTVIISTIGGWQLFAEPLLFDPNPRGSNGGSAHQFQTLGLFMYQHFQRFEAGYASAIALSMMAVMIIAALANYLVTRRIRSS